MAKMDKCVDDSATSELPVSPVGTFAESAWVTIDFICSIFGLRASQLFEQPFRAKSKSLARALCMREIGYEFGWSSVEIARGFGIDHGSVFVACKRVQSANDEVSLRAIREILARRDRLRKEHFDRVTENEDR